MKQLQDEKRETLQSIVRTREILSIVLTIDGLRSKAIVMELRQNVIKERLSEQTHILENHFNIIPDSSTIEPML